MFQKPSHLVSATVSKCRLFSKAAPLNLNLRHLRNLWFHPLLPESVPANASKRQLFFKSVPPLPPLTLVNYPFSIGVSVPASRKKSSAKIFRTLISASKIKAPLKR
ncbi:MAG: hypothetical protein AABZ08_01700 [Planctomycetota bacterium]